MLDNYIWLIGAGRLQEPMVSEIRRRGYQILATDQNPVAYCRRWVDKLMPISTYDVDGNLAYAEKLVTNPPQAILTDTADVAVTVGSLVNFFGLPGIERSVALNIQDKSRMRLLLDPSHPVYMVIDRRTTASAVWLQWEQLCQKFSVATRAVLKPADNCASRGIKIISSLAELDAELRKTFQYNHYPRTVVLEELLAGIEYATDWFVHESQPRFVNQRVACVWRLWFRIRTYQSSF